MESPGIDTRGLKYIDNFSLPVYASFGAENRARTIAVRTEKTIDWLKNLFDLPKIPPLFVLGPADWDRIALVRQYGLAHVNRSRIVMGQACSGLWNSVLESVWPGLSTSGRQLLQRVYGKGPGLGAFSDLIISHELTHLADLPLWLDTDAGDRGWGAQEPRLLWISELFANVGLQGYVVEREPESRAALETIFEVVGRTSPAQWEFHRLHEMYDSITRPGADGVNYVWFEFRTRSWPSGCGRPEAPPDFRRSKGCFMGPCFRTPR